MAELQLISSDSHVSEPPDLWVERIDSKYRDRAPRVVLNPEGQEGAYFVYEGYPPHNLAIGLGAGKTPEELAAFLKTGTYADARLAGGTLPNGCRIWRWTGWRRRCSTPPWGSGCSGSKMP